MANSNGKQETAPLDQLEALYQEIQRQRSLNRYTTIFCVLTVLLILLVFCFRLYGIYDEYNKYATNINTENLMEVLSHPNAEVEISKHKSPEVDMAVRNLIRMSHERIAPSVKRSQERFMNRILPDFSELVTNRMADRSDEFEARGVQMLDNIKSHAETQLKEELLVVLGESMVEVSEDIRVAFPELDDKTLMKQLEGSDAYLFDELHNLGMTKVAKFDPVLRGLKTQIDKMAEDKKVTPEMREQIMNEFLEGLFDRVKYEFVPGLGDQLVSPHLPEGKSSEDKAAPDAQEAKKGGE